MYLELIVAVVKLVVVLVGMDLEQEHKHFAEFVGNYLDNYWDNSANTAEYAVVVVN